MKNNVCLEGNRRIAGVLAGLLLLLAAAQLFHVAHSTSATWDEPHHLLDGYVTWTEHAFRLNPEVPPLVKLTAALPLLPRRLWVPPDQGRTVPTEAFSDGHAFVFRNGVERTLEPARLACTVFTLGLGLLLYLWTTELFGPWAGLVALTLYAFDPNFLAHGALVTTDVGCACFFFAALYAFYRYCRQPSWLRLLLAGFVAGLLLATKFTGIFLLPMLCLLVLLEWLRTRSTKLLLQRVRAVAVLSLCGWVVLWGFYGFRYHATPPGHDINPPLAAYLKKMYDQRNAARLAVLARYRVLPEPYTWGLENTKNTEAEYTSYFWGRVTPHGHWQYFPVAFLIKSTLPVLILLALFLPAWRFGLRRNGRELAFLLVPVAVYFALSMHSDFNIGARHLLPIYPFLYVVCGGVAATLLSRDRRSAVALGLLLCWHVAEAVRIAPAYMAYGNEAWGGPSEVHRYLSDANTDWGQQLYDVKAYLARNRITDCWFVYFPDGAIEAKDYGVNCKRLPTTGSLWWMDLPMSVPPEIDGTVLISDSNLEGIEFGDGPLNPYESFRAMRPVATIDYGIDVYTGHFAVPLASALVAAHEAQKLAAAGRVTEAVARADAAIKLAPDSARVLAADGDVLLAAGNRAAARAQYQSALHQARTVRAELQTGLATELEGKIAALGG